MTSNEKIINFFWVGEKLTNIGLISLNSFRKRGYKCFLWNYGDITNIPNFVVSKNAFIITEKKEGRIELFSDYFRYKLLFKYGGIYSDLDNILLKDLPDSEYIFSGSLDFEINSHLLKTPKNSFILENIIFEIENDINAIPKIYNGEYLLNKVKEYKLEKYILPEYTLNFFKYNIVEISLKLFDWEKINDVINIHLFESKHRVIMKESIIYKQNLINLNKII